MVMAEKTSRLFQEQVGRGVGHARFLAGIGLVAALGGRDAAYGRDPQDSLGLVEDAGALAGFDVEQQPRDRARRGRRRVRLHGADHLAAAQRLPGRAGVVLADLLLGGIEQRGFRRLEGPGPGAGVVLAAGIDLHAGRRHLEIDREAGGLERGRKIGRLGSRYLGHAGGRQTNQDEGSHVMSSMRASRDRARYAAFFFALISLRLIRHSAIWMALSAAPLRRLSDTHQKVSPFSTVASSRTRLI